MVRMQASDEALDQDTSLPVTGALCCASETLDLRDTETCELVAKRVNVQVTGVVITSSIRIHLTNGRLRDSRYPANETISV